MPRARDGTPGAGSLSRGAAGETGKGAATDDAPDIERQRNPSDADEVDGNADRADDRGVEGMDSPESLPPAKPEATERAWGAREISDAAAPAVEAETTAKAPWLYRRQDRRGRGGRDNASPAEVAEGARTDGCGGDRRRRQRQLQRHRGREGGGRPAAEGSVVRRAKSGD